MQAHSWGQSKVMDGRFVKSLQPTGLLRAYELADAEFLAVRLRLVGGDSERPEAERAIREPRQSMSRACE